MGRHIAAGSFALWLAMAAVAQPPMYEFAGSRITLADTRSIPMTSTAFRGVFDLPQVPAVAMVFLEVDDQFNLYVNGRLAGSIQRFTDGKARGYRVEDLLRPGRNVVALEAYSALDKMNFGLDVRVDGPTGPVLLSSDASFRARLCPAPTDVSWTAVGYDDTAWSNATIAQPAGVMPLIEPERATEAFPFPPEAYVQSLIPANYAFVGEWIQPSPTPGQGEQGAVWASFECAKGKYDRVLAFVTGDDRYMLYVNGSQLGWDWSPVSWDCGEVFDITQDLNDGSNFITIRLMNDLPPFCAALCEVWGIRGGTGFTDGARELLLASSAGWDSMKGDLYADRADVRKPQVIGKPPCEPWFTLKAIPCRLMPTADTPERAQHR